MLQPKKKLKRKQIKEDKLMTNINNAINFFNENSKIITMALLGVVIVVVIGFFVIKSKRDANIAASGRLIMAIDQFHANNYDQAIPQLLDITQRFDGTENAGYACFYLANAYYAKGNYTEAKKYFNTYIDDYGDNKLFESAALAGIAACYAQEGNKEQAASYYQQAAKKNPELYTAADYLFSAAQNYVELNQKETAKQLLQKIVDDYSKSEKTNEAKLLLAQLSAES